ncbi:72 kDa type IV collagenase-like [Paramacrobiotus metropolitanus]|uniref:72 kDa type IV collagenase-like n=1 Tax=Paramacrobiotus metropolitanus TaxID=2943436 RepID=UPI0024463801|nr:72 kDa type IV collagenase-like [Paramacrobiotus metropolitanus]
MYKLLTVLLLVASTSVLIKKFPMAFPIHSAISESETLDYLQKFGYLPSSDHKSASMITEEQFNTALAQFQRLANIPVTGAMDAATQQMMTVPRCSVPDIPTEPLRHRSKRSLHRGKWLQRRITWAVTQPTEQLPLDDIEDEMARAWQVWTEHTDLDIRRAINDKPPNIDIRFAQYSHCTSAAFDGPGGAVAHAFYPKFGGDVHFDDSETWSTSEQLRLRLQYRPERPNRLYLNQRPDPIGLNLLYVAAHEFGHALGLEHPRTPSRGLMRPFYQHWVDKVALAADDIKALQNLYGPPPLDICKDPVIDAATTTADGRTFVFKGEFYYELDEDGVMPGYPQRISEDWWNLPGNLDAAFTWNDGTTFFFKDDKYWKFENMVPEKDYPQLINDGFPGIPNNIDAAFTWNGNNHTYFIKGNNYWRYEPSNKATWRFGQDANIRLLKSEHYPRSLTNWKGLPSKIDAVLPWTNGYTYFFTGAVYYKLNDANISVESGYPRPTGYAWLGCD